MRKSMTTTNKYFPKVHDWIDVTKKKPFDFDLVNMKCEDGSIQVGWWNGNTWENRKGVKGRVVSWKRHDARYGRND